MNEYLHTKDDEILMEKTLKRETNISIYKASDNGNDSILEHRSRGV